MKKIIALLLALITLLSLCACSSGLTNEESAEIKTETREEKKEVKTEEEEEPLPTGEIVYPEGFSVGYNRQSIAPEVFPIPTYTQFGHVGYSNHDPIQLTCTALCDGKTAFLLISIDMRGMDAGIIQYSCKLIEEAVGIPAERVMINCTHTHSAVEQNQLGQGNAMKAWQQLYYKRLVRAVTLAMHDLTPTDAFIGTAHTDGVTFSRRYLMDDGTYLTNPEGKPGIPVAYETEADTELRTVRFDRGDAKDVLLTNYQTHYHGSFTNSVSADWVHVIREYVEKEMDVHFAYHSGASANLNFKSALGDRKYKDLESASTHIAQTVIEATKKEEKAELSSLQYETSIYDGRAKDGGTKKVNFSAFTIGDVGFAAAPYEMFDTNGKEVRDASPCKMTFVCSLTNGGFGYVPSAYAYPHGAYEVDISGFKQGSGEEFAQELVRLLNVCKSRD
ncbi:MAG: hypothetical protein IJC26_05115 [Clostridia bacterium]|nr:hypothetical protein [Clostridia bacterium]